MSFFRDLRHLFFPMRDRYDRRGYGPYSPGAVYNTPESDEQRIAAVLSNPALLKVFSLYCDLFSQAKVYVYEGKKEEGISIEDDPFLTLINNPNPMQSRNGLLWDYMFFNLIGNAYCYVPSTDISGVGTNPLSKIYILHNGKIETNYDSREKADHLVLSSAQLSQWESQKLVYRYENGQTIDIPYKNIIHVPDLGGTLSGWGHAPSRIDSLYKILANIEATLDTTNINVRYAGKFMVGPRTVSETDTGLQPQERKNIKEKIDSSQPVWPTGSTIDIRRFVEDIGALKLDERYLHDFFVIGTHFGIPKDVLEASASGTYENQEKARGAMIGYCLQPKADQLAAAFEKMFKYREANKRIVFSWDHLQFMQVFEKERAEREHIKTRSLMNLVRAGVPLEEINSFLDTEFTEVNYNMAAPPNERNET